MLSMLFFDFLTSSGMLSGGISMKRPSKNVIGGRLELGDEPFLGIFDRLLSWNLLVTWHFWREKVDWSLYFMFNLQMNTGRG
jgi:hypothetical protein